MHADWSMHDAKRWMACACPEGEAWHVSVPERVGDPNTLLARLRARAGALPVALGLDCPIGLPRAYAALHAQEKNFPAFLRGLPGRAGFLEVAPDLAQVGAFRPFYPAKAAAGMTRRAHALALGLSNASQLCRLCDQATTTRPAGAPVFWTLGANQSGKAAIAAWRDLIIPALQSDAPPALWPFEGRFRGLVATGRTVIAETYPADALRQLGLVRAGSKRRQADRAAYAPLLRAAMARLRADPHPGLAASLQDGFGGDAAGEDRFDCLLGVLCVIAVLRGDRPDSAPADPWITNWEGWVLGQTHPAFPAAEPAAPG